MRHFTGVVECGIKCLIKLECFINQTVDYQLKEIGALSSFTLVVYTFTC